MQTTRTTTRVKGMGGLLTVLPQLIGTQPEPGVLLLLEAPDGIAGVSFWPAGAVPTIDWAVEARSAWGRAARFGAARGILLVCRLDPGVLDIVEVAATFGAGIELHHALTLTEEHWWATRCDFGCCDGAVHPRPGVPSGVAATDTVDTADAGHPAAEPVDDAAADTATLREAWRRISQVHARAGSSARRARLAELHVVLEGLRSSETRDIVLHALAPELVVERAVGPSTGRVVSSTDLRAWERFIPDEHRGAWLACEALALWREADDERAEAAATASLHRSGTSLAMLLCGVLHTGMTYDDAVQHSRR